MQAYSQWCNRASQVLRWAVVTPNDCRQRRRLSVDFVCQDADCTVVVQTSHGCESTGIQVRRIARDQGVGVRGLPTTNTLTSFEA